MAKKIAPKKAASKKAPSKKVVVPQKQIKKFSDIKDPKTEHKKALAKSKTGGKTSKLVVPSVVSLSEDGKKLLKFSVTPTGVYTTYLGNLKKLGPKAKELKAKHQKNGDWAEPHELQDKIEKLKNSSIPKGEVAEVEEEELVAAAEQFDGDEEFSEDDIDLEEDEV